MAQDENRFHKRIGRKTGRRRGEDDVQVDDQHLNGFSSLAKMGSACSANDPFWTGHSLYLFCRSRTTGLRAPEVVPENVYSDRSFSYISDIRQKEAEEWIRSSTPREFARNFLGEENYGAKSPFKRSMFDYLRDGC